MRPPLRGISSRVQHPINQVSFPWGSSRPEFAFTKHPSDSEPVFVALFKNSVGPDLPVSQKLQSFFTATIVSAALSSSRVALTEDIFHNQVFLLAFDSLHFPPFSRITPFVDAGLTGVRKEKKQPYGDSGKSRSGCSSRHFNFPQKSRPKEYLPVISLDCVWSKHYWPPYWLSYFILSFYYWRQEQEDSLLHAPY